MSSGTIIFLVTTLIVILGAVVLSLQARSRRGPELEPPATRPASTRPPASPPPPAPRTERAPGDAPVGSETDVEVDEALAAEVEAALSGVEAPPRPPETPPAKVALRDRLGKARGALAGYLGSVRARTGIDQTSWDDLEEALILADVGVTGTTELLDAVRAQVKASSIKDTDALLDALKAEMKHRLEADRGLRLDEGVANVWLFVGVNGVGKTTTIGKLGKRMHDQGTRVVMAAGDTFRAAAAEQLGLWAERSGADFVRGAEGGDPSSIIFDAVQRAGARNLDLVLADTAGRLHTKTNLMEELRKVRRVADREPGRVTEVLLVLDATTGQNGLQQARQFTEAVEVTGVVLTKLDGSAKGGIVLAIHQDLGIPVKLVGLGEGVEDLVEFDPGEFVDALFE